MTDPFRSRLARVLLLAACATSLGAVTAQETEPENKAADLQLEVDETLISPLALPDTSSPRATLKSFFDNFEATFGPYYENRTGKVPRRGSPTSIRMFRTMDTSHLPPAEATRRAAEAALLLNEVISRVGLPPYEEIPDAETMEALAPEGPRIWRIPRTDIQIVQIQEGARAGEYLFSADTIKHAHDYWSASRISPCDPDRWVACGSALRTSPAPCFPSRDSETRRPG